jgi:hypothetical protein
VPSKPDNNPEHLHLFDGPTLTATLQRAGAVRVSVDHVPDHLTVVARVGPP